MNRSERRHFVRVACENLLAYCVLQEGGIIDSTRADLVNCKNISKGGLLFLSREKFDERTILKLKLRIDDTDKNTQEIVIIGEVARCRVADSSGKYDVGIFICCIEKAKRDIFFNWLNKRLKNISQMELFNTQ